MSTTYMRDGPDAEVRMQTDAMSGVLAENWWAVALRGVLAILFGLIAFVLPGATILSLILVFAAYMMVDGVFTIIAALRAAQRRNRWGLLVLEGIVSIAAGILAFLWPGITVLAFVLLVAAWALVTGVLELWSSWSLNREHGRWWLAFSGVASIIFGVLLLIAPLIGALVLTWWVGAYAFVAGIMLLVLAFRLRTRKLDRSTLSSAAT
jgi:uncharacterized membrane protein HdeD (DUF308 family)